jgi:putative intracellular protease/amidase
MKVLTVLTSHDQLGNTGRKTGFWLEEMAAPYYVFKDAGAQITLASPRAGAHRWIPRATSRTSRPTSPVGSRRMPTPKPSSTGRCASIASTPDGKLLVAGKTVTGFTNGEEDEVGLTKVVPFIVEDELLRLGATFSTRLLSF